MEKSSKPITQDYLLRPGFIYLPQKPTAISTVLGSSVSVTLYDRKLKIGGMNHFLYPYMKKKENATALYGDIAVAALVRMMKIKGSKTSNIEAQIFGGAFNPKQSKKDIGKGNLKAARTCLQNYGISVVSEDVGGQKGRKIVFNTVSCETLTLKVERLRESDWYPYASAR